MKLLEVEGARAPLPHSWRHHCSCIVASLSSVCLSVCLSIRRLQRRGRLNAKGVAKYRDFGPIEGYISETVQDSR